MAGPDEDQFKPNETSVELIEGNNVKISFHRDNGTNREVVLPRKWLPQFAAQIVSKIEHGQMVPID